MKPNIYLFYFILFMSCTEVKKESLTGTVDSIKTQIINNQSTEIDNKDTLQIIFGLSDMTGKKLITNLNDSIHDYDYNLIDRDGSIINILYITKRQESEESSHRQTADNFDNIGGNLFNISGASIESDNTFLILPQNMISKYVPQKINKYGSSKSYSQDTSRIRRYEQREIEKVWFKGTFGDSGSIYIVHFKGNDSIPLAGLYVLNSKEIVCEKYKGSIGDDSSVWRVDDEGEFDGNSIDIIGMFFYGNNIIIGRSWAGVEGENSKLLMQKNNDFIVLKEDYRYWVSE